MEFGEHRVETHARETDLSVVYTIDPAMVDDYINNVEQLLARDKYKVVSIDLQYTTGRPGIDQKVVVAQLCMRLRESWTKWSSGVRPVSQGPDGWAVKIQRPKTAPVSGWDSPWRGRQAWRPNMYIPFFVTDPV